MRGIMPEEARRGAGKILPHPLLDAAVHSTPGIPCWSCHDEEPKPRGLLTGGCSTKMEARTELGKRRRPYYWFSLALEMWLREYWP